MLTSKSNVELKPNVYISIGKLSTIISKDNFHEHAISILKIIKNEIEKNSQTLTLTIFDCLANLMKNFKSTVLTSLNHEDVLTKMFYTGFYDSHCQFLIQLLSAFDDNSFEHIKIIIVILNVISIIICDRKFTLKETINYLKNFNMDVDTTTIYHSQSFMTINKSDYDTSTNDKEPSRKNSANFPLGYKEFLNLSRKAIINYVIQYKSTNKTDFYKVMGTLAINALNFLKHIKHAYFAKDILQFYQSYCLKYLEQNDSLTVKEVAISLATAPWIPRVKSKQDNDVEYMLNIILDSYLNVVLNDQNDDVKLKMMNNLDDRYDRLLATNKFFNKLTKILNFHDNNLREKIVSVIGRILQENYTTIIIYIKKSIMEIFNLLDLSQDPAEKEDAIILLNFYVKYAGIHILDYVELIFSTLIKLLKKDCNDILNISILSIVSELISSSKNNKHLNEDYFKQIILICIENLQDNSSIVKQEISLKTILSILENSNIEWKIYFDYPLLVSLLIQILTKESNKNSRLYCLRIFGFIGAMGPDKLEKIWSIHKIENNFVNENYDIDEYNNYDDEEIIAHKRQHLIKTNKEKKSVKLKIKLPDFQKMIIDQELDPCTYHAVRALMNILKDSSLEEPSIQVIVILGSLLKSLQDSDAPVVDLILPTLLETIDKFEPTYIKAIFDHILIILKTFKANFKKHIKEVLDTVIKYIKEKEFQVIVFSILIKMLEEFLDELEIYFPQVIPLLLNLLDNNTAVHKQVFSCLSLISDRLSNYLSIILPETLKYISYITTNCELKNSPVRTVQFEESLNSKIHDDVFIFIERIISLPNFSQHLPKVVNALLKYLEVNLNSQERVMNIFIVMNEKLRADFLIFLPTIIRTVRTLNINIAPYFAELKAFLDKDEIIEELKNRNNEGNKLMSKRKRSRTSSGYYDNRDMIKNRKGQIDKDLLVKEFDPVNCSIEEDWKEWFKSTSKILFEQSPSYALYYCHNVADYYTPLLNELYNYAFVSCWRNLNDYHKMSIIHYLNIALNSKIPNEILLTILNLAEFIEREENHIDFIDFSKLGDVADICKAYAKALYYKENDFRNNNDFNTLEDLIALYYELKLPEASIGIIKMAQQNNRIINEDDWYLKLHKWEEALMFYNKRLLHDKRNPDLLKGKFTCLEGLCDWESLLNLADEIEENQKDSELVKNMSPVISKAALSLNEWDKLKYYIDKITPEDYEEDYDKNFFQAVLAIKEKEYKDAKIYIEKARNIIDDKIKTLLSESYGRAYKLLLENEHLYELEEIIIMNTETKDNLSREKLKLTWDHRLENVDEDIETYDRILSIRSLVFHLDEDYDKHLDLAKICRNEDRFVNCLNVLNRLNRRLGNYEKSVKIKVELDINKCLYENNMQDKAIKNLKHIIDSEISFSSDSLKSKVYMYYGKWNLQKYESNLNEENVRTINTYLELSTKFNKSNYNSWHYYALLNYKYFDYLSNNEGGKSMCIKYAQNALTGFSNSVCIGEKNISKTLQDLLRLIDVWFIMGENEEIEKLIYKSFDIINIDSWLLVIPQLLARVNIVNEKIRNSLVHLLKQIGTDHPRSLIYPLIVMRNARSIKRREASESILNYLVEKHNTLVDECSLIIEELNRCAMLLHEEWCEAIEESAKLYFQNNEIKGMIKILMEVHNKMDKKPETMNEVHFHQLYASDLLEAKGYVRRYLDTLNEMDLKQAWDIYHSVFKQMNDAFSDVKSLDLENVSPKLHSFKESEICVPGLYKSGYPVIRIRGFEKQLSVLSSKQHPRKIIIYGSDDKDYMFLLKGHEDLRQDERAMQLFGLINTLLANDPDTATKNLFIKRFAVIPLSHNTGIIGWVPHCDTLHQLIKEYRTTNKIIQNVEHRLMFTICPKFESAAFMNKLEVFKYALNNTQGLDLYKILWKKSKSSEAWLDRRTNYSRSLAVMSMVGYILGLGDRHPSNLMLDRHSGKIIHIDFGDCFEVAMKREKFPERVPFRLTRMLIKALEVSGIEGTYRMTCENVMRVLRMNKDSLIAILASFVHDPLISFRLMIPLILKARVNEIKFKDNRKSTKQMTRIELSNQQLSEDFEDEPRKRKMGSTERQLYNLFEERGK
jgi:FKBP12-rapamycin complex-associated protein